MPGLFSSHGWLEFRVGVACRAVALLLLAGPAVWADTVAGHRMLDEGFEGPVDATGVAEQWRDNSDWGDTEVRYGRDTDRPHRGDACQRIDLRRIGYGAVQFVPKRTVALRSGRIYRAETWVRGDVGRFSLMLRRAGTPYTQHAQQTVRTTDTWQRIRLFWRCDVDEPRACLMLRFVEAGTVWIDDVLLEEMAPEEVAPLLPQPTLGNRLHNGDFELGPANWLPHHHANDWREWSMSIEGPPGDRMLKMTVPDKVRAILHSDAVSVIPGHPINVACRIRADRPTEVWLGSMFCGRRREVGDEWVEMKATGRLPLRPLGNVWMAISAAGPATIWVKDARVWQGEENKASTAARAALIADRHPFSYYNQPDGPRLRLLSVDGPVTLNWEVENLASETVRSGTHNAGREPAQKSLDMTDLPCGWYRARVAWSAGEERRTNEATFCVLPPSERATSAEESPFGAHVSPGPTGIKIARAVGVKWLRLHPPNYTKWRTVEPESGQHVWHDEAIRRLRQAGFSLCGSLDRCPDWASSAPADTPESSSFYKGRGAWPPRDWAEWERYVATVVRRYRGQIDTWEVWNEPNLTDWFNPLPGRTRAETYVDMLRHTYPVVKRENPEATVLGGCVAGVLAEDEPAGRFAYEMIERGGLEWMDRFSYHQYLLRAVDEGPHPIDTWLPKLQKAMKQDGHDRPIINSEGGLRRTDSSLTHRLPDESIYVTTDRMASLLVRQYVAQLALGVRRFYFYNFFVYGRPRASRFCGFLEGDGQPRPTVPAYATMTWLLDRARFQRTDHPKPGVWVHRFGTPRGPLVVAWARTGTTAELDLPDAAKAWTVVGTPEPVRNPMPIGEAPTYVLLRQPLVSARRDRSFPPDVSRNEP